MHQTNRTRMETRKGVRTVIALTGALAALAVLTAPAAASDMHELPVSNSELLPLAASLAAAGGAAIALVDLHHAQRGRRLGPDLARRQLATGVALDVLAVPVLLSGSDADATPRIAGVMMATGGLGLITRACLALAAPGVSTERPPSSNRRVQLHLTPRTGGGSVGVSGSF